MVTAWASVDVNKKKKKDKKSKCRRIKIKKKKKDFQGDPRGNAQEARSKKCFVSSAIVYR